MRVRRQIGVTRRREEREFRPQRFDQIHLARRGVQASTVAGSAAGILYPAGT